MTGSVVPCVVASASSPAETRDVPAHLERLGFRRRAAMVVDGDATAVELLTYAVDPVLLVPADPARALALSIELDADVLGCAIRSGELDQSTIDAVLGRMGRQAAVVAELLRRREQATDPPLTAGPSTARSPRGL